MFKDKTRHQHFISVSEQRLNSSNPVNKERRKIKIYSFDLLDREQHLIQLSENSERNAEKNLKEIDLYTFEVLDDGQRLCFESLFSRLENKVAECTNKILDNDSFTVDDFLNVFKAKILNMIRNPYCIKFTLNNFGNLSEHYPTDSDLKINFDKIDNCSISSEIIAKYDVQEDEYKKWLKIIFLMITPLNEGKYILDDYAENFFNFEKYLHLIVLCKYTNEACLLSDRSYVNLTELFNNVSGLSFGFNLRRDAFIYITFMPNDLAKISTELLGSQGRNIAEFLIKRGINSIQTNLNIQCYLDNLDLLKNYNKHVIYQCAKNVYASKIDILT